MMIAGDAHQDRFAAEILAEVEAIEAAENIARFEAIEVVAARRNFGAYGIEQYVELGETVRSLEAARVKYLDKKEG